MAGFSEVLQTIGAIIIFSLILLTSNRMILSNSLREVESEAEGIAVTLAQGIIEEAQTKAFDKNTVKDVPLNTPEGFSKIGSEGVTAKENFDDFDDYNDYSETISTPFGNDTLSVEVLYVSAANNYDIDQGVDGDPKSERTHFKKMRVTVNSQYLENEVQLEYLQRYYKTKN